MKKATTIFLFVAAIVAAYLAGRSDGISHAVNDAEIYTVQRYDPENPYQNARPDGTDQTIYIIIDGTEYECGMYQG